MRGGSAETQGTHQERTVLSWHPVSQRNEAGEEIKLRAARVADEKSDKGDWANACGAPKVVGADIWG